MAEAAERVAARPKPREPASELSAQRHEALERRADDNAYSVMLNRRPAGPRPAPRGPNRTGLPDGLKAGVESLSGLSMDDVKVHYRSARPAQLQAHAFTQGSDIHVAPGQARHLPHEAWHVVQQKQGRVRATMQLKEGVPVNDDCGLEREADEMGAKAAAADRLALSSPVSGSGGRATDAAGVVQRQLAQVAEQDYFTDSRDGDGLHYTPTQNAGMYNGPNNRVYSYDPATRQYLVPALGAAQYWDVAGKRMLRRRALTVKGEPLHLYMYGFGNNPANRYYYAAHLYAPVPTGRVNWIDSNGRFVEETLPHGAPAPVYRVLTPDGLAVEKQYAVTKLGDEFVVPHKKMGAPFLPGLPALFGGNVDPGEDAEAALRRETLEESGHGLAIGQIDPQSILQNQEIGPRANRYTIDSATLDVPAPQPGPPPPMSEMAGNFRVAASQFVDHGGGGAATKQRLLDLFAKRVPGQAAHVAGLAPDAKNKWMASHSMVALAGRLSAEAAPIETGRDLARNAQPVPVDSVPGVQQGFDLYQAGVLHARAGQGAAQPDQPAFVTGQQDYLDGLLAAQTAGPPPAAAPPGLVPEAQAAFDEYQTGFGDGLVGAGPASQDHAYMQGHAAGTAAALNANAQAVAGGAN